MTTILAETPNELHYDANGYTSDEESDVSHQSIIEGLGTSPKLQTFHPLENRWTFWYDRRPQTNKRMPGEKEQYESNLRPVGTVGSVEEFWRYYNHLMKPSRLDSNANYHFFKDGIKPMWEDPANTNGGKWIVQFKGADKYILDTFWENLLLGMIGETIDVGDEICGCVVSKRKAGDKIAVWNRSREAETEIMTLGRFLKGKLGVDPSKLRIEYQTHEDSMRSGLSYLNPKKYQL